MSDLNIYQRMHAVMKAVSYVQKEEKKVNNQYTFVSHDAVTAKIRPALIENGIVTVPRVTKWQQDGNRTECDLEVDFVNIDKPEERLTVSMFGFGIDPQDKGPGKAISYAVKYALLKAFSLETGDDPEKDQIEHKPDVKLAKGETPGKLVDLDLAMSNLTPEGRVQAKKEASLIENDFYKIGVKAAHGSWLALKAQSGEEESSAVWELLDSKTRSAISKLIEQKPRYPVTDKQAEEIL